MLRTILSYMQVAHVGIILYLTLQLYQYPEVSFDINLAIAEIVLTAIDVFLIRRSLDLVPLIISASLFSSFLPPFQIDIDWLPILFTAKILYVSDILVNAKRLVFSGDNCAFCQVGGILYDFVRCTVVEYLFLGVVIMVYKAIVLHFDQSVTQLPPNYVLFYQMIVTATTIGYGDVCPKSRIQMNFFTGAIPFILGSFVMYANNVNPLWEQFVAYLNEPAIKANQSAIDVSSMSQSEKTNLNEFTLLSAEKKREQDNLKQLYFNDWISLAAISYEQQAELIHTIVDSSCSKEAKMTIASKIRQQYFPKDWIVLNSNDISEDLYMVAEGEIDINGETKSTGFVFNQKGFFCQAISGDKVVTKSFVTLWAVTLAELEELARNNFQIKEKINIQISLNSKGY